MIKDADRLTVDEACEAAVFELGVAIAGGVRSTGTEHGEVSSKWGPTGRIAFSVLIGLTRG